MLPIRPAPVAERWEKYINLASIKTKKEFDSYCEENPEYKISQYLYNDSKTIVHSLLQTGLKNSHAHYNLLVDIIEQNGKDILNNGDYLGITPLLWSICDAISLQSHESSIPYKSIKTIALCSLGVDVNLSIPRPVDYSRFEETIPKGATPLWLALEKTDDLFVVVMLLSCGANPNCEPLLSKKGKTMLEQAQVEINSTHSRFSAAQESECLLNNIPTDLVPIIQHYNKSLAAEYIVRVHSNYAEANNLPEQALFNMMKNC